jgi:hypothetical protein
MEKLRSVLGWIGGLLALQLVLALPFLIPATARAASYTHLNPGGPANLAETVPVNIVFVGYEPEEVNQTAFLAALPQQYSPVIRSRLWYGVEELLGLHYRYGYRVVYTNDAYERRFFNYLSSIATPADPTLYQQLYNDQQRNVRDVADNHFIDAPSVEKWLAKNPPGGVDTRRNTVYFINWWGNGTSPRPGFKHHVYTKFGEPDPDTGYDFGRNRASRKIIAWGGTTPDDPQTGLGGTYRVWFYDLSAGPESFTDNWNVDTPDLDGDGVEEYRMPPVWEYFAPNGYRPASALTGDLAKIARYVAINLLFTPSPIYPPGYTPKRLPGQINLDFTVYEGTSGVNATRDYLKPGYVLERVQKVHRVPYTYDVQTYKLNSKTRSCYYRYAALLNNPGLVPSVPCYREYSQYPGEASLFLDNTLNLGRIRDGYGGEYEAPVINYAVEDVDNPVPAFPPFLGLADDNWLDGTQSFTYNILSPAIIGAGYGLTTTDIHEYGHHLALSHPHDGYDYEQGIDYGVSGDFYFTWSGTESNSIMSYIDLNWDYSQFDRDNINRFYAAAYIANANGIAADVLASPNAAAAAADLQAADAAIGAATAALARHDYPATFDNAKLAYETVRAGAARAGVAVQPSDRGVFVQPPAGRVPIVQQRKIETTVDRLGPNAHRLRP